MGIMHDLDALMEKLAQNNFRARFRLDEKELSYLRQKGMSTVLEHGRDFLTKRLAPAKPHNDGKQTPWRGHPVFVAQHATATCCRGCISKWHRIEKGRALTDEELSYLLSVIERWLQERSCSCQVEVPNRS